ncbi:MAG TPA: hypothetical protein PLI97_01255 [Fluviicola sp.]|nr:hypothetical protein [Fluviicola sp.]
MTSHIQTIYTLEKSAFADTVNAWLESLGFHVVAYQETSEQIELIDAVVMFHDNHNFDKKSLELRTVFETHQAPIHKIDLSGTMNVALTHLSLFFERTKCKHVLFLGSDSLKGLPKMDVFKENWNI